MQLPHEAAVRLLKDHETGQLVYLNLLATLAAASPLVIYKEPGSLVLDVGHSLKVISTVTMLGNTTIDLAVLTIVLTLTGRFLYKGYVWRRNAGKLVSRRVSLLMRPPVLTFSQPGPPHHPIFGHMKIMAEATRASPRGAAGQNVLLMVKHLYDLPDLFYLDLWPLFESICITTHPSISSQFVVRRSMPKHPCITF